MWKWVAGAQGVQKMALASTAGFAATRETAVDYTLSMSVLFQLQGVSGVPFRAYDSYSHNHQMTLLPGIKLLLSKTFLLIS